MRFQIDDTDEFSLNDKGRAYADRIDPDGTRACVREGREHYAAGRVKQGDAMVVLLACRGAELGDEQLKQQALELRDLGETMRMQ